MKRRCLLLLAVMGLLAATALSQDSKKDRKAASSAGGKATGSDLRFIEDGDDLIVRLMIEGPAANQVVLTDYDIDSGQPTFEESLYPGGSDLRPPSVLLRYCVIIDGDLPGFVDRGLLAVPTPPEVREQQRQEVEWRLRSFRNWGFRIEDATFHVKETRFRASTEQLRQAWPKLKRLVEYRDKKVREEKAPPPAAPVSGPRG